MSKGKMDGSEVSVAPVMELAFYDEHGRFSPGLPVIDVFGDWRSGSLISP